MGINKEGKLFAIEREITYRDYTLKESFRSGCPSFRPASCLIWFASVVCLSYPPRFTPPYSPLQSPHTTSTSEVERIRKPRRPPNPIDINGRKRRKKKHIKKVGQVSSLRLCKSLWRYLASYQGMYVGGVMFHIRIS